MATSLPRFTIATRSESLSASSIMLVATITVEPSSLSSRIIFHISSLLGTSRKAVGSSNTAIFGRCARTLQSSTFFRIPPLINQVLLFLASQRSTARKTFSTRSSRSTLSRFVVIFKCQLRTSKAPSIPSTRGSWKAIPIIFLTSFGC